MLESAAGVVLLVVFLMLVAILIAVALLWLASAAGTVVFGGAFLKSLIDGLREAPRMDEGDTVEQILERHGAELKRRKGTTVSVSVDEERLDALISDLREHGYDADLTGEDPGKARG